MKETPRWSHSTWVVVVRAVFTPSVQTVPNSYGNRWCLWKRGNAISNGKKSRGDADWHLIEYRPNLSDQIRSVQSLSRVRLFATPWIAAHQASLSLTNSWSSLRLTSIESVMPSIVNSYFMAKLCLILCNRMNCSPPGSSVNGIFQARVPEWVAISFVSLWSSVNRCFCEDGSSRHILCFTYW